jgi:hypothetical protein
MIKKITTSRSAIFFRLIKPLSETFVEKLFKETSINRDGNYIEKTIKTTYTNSNAKISLMIYKFNEEPSFLKGSKLQERKYAFLMLIEIDDFLIVFRKHIFGLEKFLKNHCKRLKYEEIQYLYSGSTPSYEKMSLANMGISRAAILRKSYESNDLKGQLGAQTSRRSVPTTTTIKTERHRHVLRPNSSSISKTDSKSNMNDLLDWIKEVIVEIKKKKRKNEFLDSFAQPVEFEEIERQNLIPSALLLNLSEIHDLLTQDYEFVFNDAVLSNKNLHKTLNQLSSTFYVQKNGNIFKIHKPTGKKQIGLLKINSKSITIQSKLLNKCVLKGDGLNISLQKYINSKQLFTITFNSPEYIYLERKIFKDRGITSHCKEIEAALKVMDFSKITSEKGSFRKDQKNFDTSSVFNFLEANIVDNNSILICDDLGDEWADYIEIKAKPPGITLLHCKWGDISTSASKLHDVVSQALKNLGRVSFSESEISKKCLNWKKTYSNDLVTTKISRIRSKHTPKTVLDTGLEIMRSPTVIREIAIVVSFLSKSELVASFKKMTSNSEVKPHIPQLIWLLSSYTAACKDLGITPTIYCSK